jgi:hypothetical protein
MGSVVTEHGMRDAVIGDLPSFMDGVCGKEEALEHGAGVAYSTSFLTGMVRVKRSGQSSTSIPGIPN